MVPVKLRENTLIERCPKCGNNTEFSAFSRQCGVDICEIWVKCSCGYDPTGGDSMKRVEDTWGSLTQGTIEMALDVWNGEIQEARSPA